NVVARLVDIVVHAGERHKPLALRHAVDLHYRALDQLRPEGRPGRGDATDGHTVPLLPRVVLHTRLSVAGSTARRHRQVGLDDLHHDVGTEITHDHGFG